LPLNSRFGTKESSNLTIRSINGLLCDICLLLSRSSEQTLPQVVFLDKLATTLAG
jgi:hypothetical protein